MSKGILVAVLAGASLLALLLLVWRKWLSGGGPAGTDEWDEEIEVETLDLRDVIGWFKERRARYEGGSTSAVLMKAARHEQPADGRRLLFQTFFNTESNEVRCGRRILARRLSPELEAQFGDKEMIVFT